MLFAPSHTKTAHCNLLTLIGVFCILALSPTAAHAAESTKNFVKDASIGNRFEIKSSKLALEKSQDPNVRKFAQHMIDDHSKNLEDLRTAISSANDADVGMPGSSLDKKHQKLLKKLGDKSGRNFDMTYIDDQIDAHDDAVSLYEGYAESGDNDTLKNFASTSLPTLQEHQQDIKQIKSMEE